LITKGFSSRYTREAPFVKPCSPKQKLYCLMESGRSTRSDGTFYDTSQAAAETGGLRPTLCMRSPRLSIKGSYPKVLSIALAHGRRLGRGRCSCPRSTNRAAESRCLPEGDKTDADADHGEHTLPSGSSPHFAVIVCCMIPQQSHNSSTSLVVFTVPVRAPAVLLSL